MKPFTAQEARLISIKGILVGLYKLIRQAALAGKTSIPLPYYVDNDGQKAHESACRQLRADGYIVETDKQGSTTISW